MNTHPHIKNLFEPKTVAVVGASATAGKIGYIVVDNLLRSGFKGKIFPVNPKGGEIDGLPVVPGIKDLPDELDLAVICLPPNLVVPSIDELGEKGTRAAVVITAGFKEVGREGWDREDALRKTAEKHNMALLGPNCLGMVNTENGANASFAPGTPLRGNIAFFSQSGALCAAILDWAKGENIGFSKFISLGNKAVLSEADMLTYLRDDPETKVILGYCESLENGREFMAAARQTTRQKPVILLKAGNSAAGAKAAGSHTGAIAGATQAYVSAFTQTGVIRALTVHELFILAQSFSTQPLPKGPNLIVVTNSGGPGILTADACDKTSLTMVRPSPATVEELRSFLPSFASLYNPIDIIGDASPERYAQTLKAVVNDEMAHAILVLLTPTASIADKIERTAQGIIDIAAKSSKPIFTCFMGQEAVGPGRQMLQNAGIPCYEFPEPAIQSIDAMYTHYQWVNSTQPVGVCFRRDKARAAKVLAEARAKGFTELVEFQAQEVVEAYELPMAETKLARTSDQAVKAASKMGFPVVLKIASPQISHKSDIKGVVTGLMDEESVRKAFLEVTSRASRLRKDAYITGCVVQKMAAKKSKEVIIGFKRDPQFGPLIMFGLGGIYVEVLKDISFRLAPLTLDDAQRMIREIHSFPLLRGVRGEPPVDFKAIEDILLTISQLAMDFPEIHEADFNPVLVSPEGAVVADVRMSLDQNTLPRTRRDTMPGIYIGSTSGYSGKNMIVMGIGLKLKKDGLDVGYMKPVGAMPLEVEGRYGDEDAYFVQDVLGVDHDPRQVTPVLVTHDFKVKAFKGETPDLMKDIEAAYTAIQKNADVTLVAGSGSMYSGKYCNLDGISVVKKLGLKAIIIDRFKKEMVRYDQLLIHKEELGDNLLGVILNDIPPMFMDELENMIKPLLESRGVKVLGVIPKDPLMSAIKVSDLAERLGGKVVSAHSKSDRVVENFLIGTMQVENFLTHFRKNKNSAVIVGGDRSDVQLVALEGDCPCLVLTGNLYPNDIILTRSEVLETPIIIVRDDTFTVAKKMESILSRHKLRDTIKIKQGSELVATNIDMAYIKKSLEL